MPGRIIKILHKAIAKENALVVEIGSKITPGNSESYKNDLCTAIEQARSKQCPLYIRPLVSANGWKANQAAELFCNVLANANDVDVTIDIPDLKVVTDNTRDFKYMLISYMHDNGITIADRGANDKEIFVNIIDNLIATVKGDGKKPLDELGEAKIANFLKLKQSITDADNMNTENWTEQILNICKQNTRYSFFSMHNEQQALVDCLNDLLTASEYYVSGQPVIERPDDANTLTFGEAGEQPSV